MLQLNFIGKKLILQSFDISSLLVAFDEARLFSLDLYLVPILESDQVLQLEAQPYCLVSSNEKEVCQDEIVF